METEVRETAPFERTVTLRIEGSELDAAKTRAARKLSQSLKIKGFRPGKAPRSVVERMVGADTLRSEAIDEALPELLAEALRREELDPVTSPRLEAVRDRDDGLEVEVSITLWPEVEELPDYAGRHVIIESPEVEGDDVARQVDRVRGQFAELEEVARPSDSGDFVLVNITASRDGAELPEAAATDLMYEIGSGSFLPGLDDALLGASPGEIRETATVLPEGFGEETAGPADLKVLVKEVKARKLPELTDEWVTEVSEFETVAELEEAVRADLQTVKLEAARREYQGKLMEVLVGELEVSLPQALIDAETENSVHNLAHRLEGQQISLADYLRVTGRDEEAFIAEMREQAVGSLKARLLLEAAARDEGIDVTGDEVVAAIEALAARSGDDADRVRAGLLEGGRVQVLAGDILRQKALDHVLRSARPVDAGGEPIDLEFEALAPEDTDTDDEAAPAAAGDAEPVSAEDEE